MQLTGLAERALVLTSHNLSSTPDPAILLVIFKPWCCCVCVLHSSRTQAIKFLQQAVGLRGYASKDPLTEFKLEGYNLFLETMAQIRRNVIYNVYVFQPQRIRPDAAAGQQQQQVAEQQAASGAGNGKQSRRKAKASA
jgi:preprotein translocase subunit SecA